jgi:hypothetical protein
MKAFAALAGALTGSLTLLISAPAPAAVMQLGNSGWTASWDSSLDPYLSLGVDYVDQNVVVIEKFARFVNSPVEGAFETIAITFQQTRADASRYIVINDEIVENLTGEDWSGFVFALIGDDVKFDVGRTSIGDSGGFYILPFTRFEYSNGDKILTLTDGTVSSVAPVTNLWFPGSAAGALWVDASPTSTGPFRSFTLTEQPIPEPASVGGLVLGGWMLLRRRSTRLHD